LQRDGKSIREIAEAVHVSVPTVFRSLRAVSKTSSSSLA
jgi:DNA-binding MurR/RpiR family transcriptional regulator